MSTLVVPALDEKPWPSLGPLVVQWIEDNLCFGPGDLLGEPARVDRETRAIIRRAYEIFPQGHAFEGRRRFMNVAMSLPKGTAKTERAAWITIAEAHPDAPVRFAGWDEDGQPRGRGIVDPYIPLLATTEGQSETLTYDAVKAILERSEVAGDFNVGLGHITREDGRGKIEAVATSPDSLDGKRTTFQVFDETHRLTDDRERKAYQVMIANVIKREAADGWSLATTTAYMPGQGSVAETMHETAQGIANGRHKDPSLFFFHRQANDGHHIARPHEVRDGSDNSEEVRLAVVEAFGPSAEWANVGGMVTLWRNPETDLSYFERVILNRPVASESQVFDMNTVRRSIWPRYANSIPPRRTVITLGFDGSRTHDATALVGTEVDSGYQFMIGFWEKPEEAGSDWEVPEAEVQQTVEHAMSLWRVKLMYADYAFWETAVNGWAGRWPKVVIVFPTSQLKKTAYAVRQYVQAWRAEEVKIDGHPKLLEHLGNARKKELTMKDEDGDLLYLMRKDRRGSPNRIDAAYAAMLSWEAREQAIKAGALNLSGSQAGRTTVYV